MHVTLPHHFYDPVCALESGFHSAVVENRAFKIVYRKNCRHFMLILTEVRKVLENVLHNPYSPIKD